MEKIELNSKDNIIKLFQGVDIIKHKIEYKKKNGQ